jgi:para-aminobenzoate synthetase component I
MWTREIPFIDPVAAAARLRSLPGLAFLDSAMRHDPLGRYAIVAADPFARFRFRDGQATLDRSRPCAPASRPTGSSPVRKNPSRVG